MRWWSISCLLVALALALPARASAEPATPVSTGPRAEVLSALGVLHDWDARREAAWSAGSATAVRALYVPGSSAGAADLRLLRRYAARGVRVRSLVVQVYAVRVLARAPGHLRIRVLDRVAGGVVARGSAESSLGTTPAVRRTLDLERAGGVWRVKSVTP